VIYRSARRERHNRLCKAVLTDPNLTPTTPHGEHGAASLAIADSVKRCGPHTRAGSYGSEGWIPVPALHEPLVPQAEVHPPQLNT